MSKRTKFQSIREYLKTREIASREIRKQIHAASGMDRWHLWNEKRDYGRETRDTLLAYGFLRGLPYRACEPKCGDHNPPSITGILSVARFYVPETGMDEAVIKSWLEAGEQPAATSVAAE
jgi:hypothetical protein